MQVDGLSGSPKSKQPIKQKAAKVYLPEWKYNQLQAKLRGQTPASDVSKWFREKVDEELGVKNDDTTPNL